MLRNFLCFLTVATLLSAFPSEYVQASEDEAPELYAAARSLGSETDCLKIANYAHDYSEKDEYPITDEDYLTFLKKCSILEGIYAPVENFSSLAFSGSCLGVSLVEILTHNGLISPSDIQEGAKTLSDVMYSKEVDRIISGYQWAQGYTIFDNYEKYLVNAFSYEEQVDRLVETAEKCEESGKYFFTGIFDNTGFAHAVCGIGIESGNWNFNDIDYDRCVLTLDSNSVDGDGNSAPFSNKGCIYINSETKQSYIPAYDTGSDKEIAYSVIDDDTLLNYKGVINPSEKTATDVSDITAVMFDDVSEKTTSIYTVSGDGEQKPVNSPDFAVYNALVSYDRFDSVHIEMKNEYNKFPLFRYINSDRWIDLNLLNGNANGEMYGDYSGVIDISDNRTSIENSGGEPLEILYQIRMDRGTFGFDPYFWWTVSGDIEKSAEFEVRDDGILIETDGETDLYINASAYELDNNGNYVTGEATYKTTSVQPVDKYEYNSDRLVKVDGKLLVTVQNGDFVFLLDKNGDDIYDVPVETGDVNFDGFIDASDASAVLGAYSALSTGGTPEVDMKLADFNGDSLVDASDASDILARYAELSTMTTTK